MLYKYFLPFENMFDTQFVILENLFIGGTSFIKYVKVKHIPINFPTAFIKSLYME